MQYSSFLQVLFTLTQVNILTCFPTYAYEYDHFHLNFFPVTKVEKILRISVNFVCAKNLSNMSL